LVGFIVQLRVKKTANSVASGGLKGSSSPSHLVVDFTSAIAINPGGYKAGGGNWKSPEQPGRNSATVT